VSNQEKLCLRWRRGECRSEKPPTDDVTGSWRGSDRTTNSLLRMFACSPSHEMFDD